MHLAAQVTTTVLKSGEEIASDIVVVGVGARPNVELLKGQVDLLEDKPGGIKVSEPAPWQGVGLETWASLPQGALPL